MKLFILSILILALLLIILVVRDIKSEWSRKSEEDGE